MRQKRAYQHEEMLKGAELMSNNTWWENFKK